jgi:hypothetical protein
MLEPILLVENEQYTKAYLRTLFNEYYIKQMLEAGVCKELKGNKVTFKYVGMLLQGNFLLFILPKYVKRDASYQQKKKSAQQILRVLKKYSRESQWLATDSEHLNMNLHDKSVSNFAMADFLIRDYINYGLYSKDREKFLINEAHEIYWDKTINEITPVISNKRPVYLETYSLVKSSDPYNYITQIHEWAVNDAINRYSEFLDFQGTLVRLDTNISRLEDLGKLEFLSSIVQRELNSAYTDRKIQVLKVLLNIINNKLTSNKERMELFGTFSFHVVWEKVLGDLFNNQFEAFKGQIPKPKWKSDLYPYPIEADTLRPDIIRTFKANERTKPLFFLLDAKYYSIQITDNKVVNNPGVEDVTKQLFYAKVLSDYKETHTMVNAFLFPAIEELEDLFFKFGSVSLDEIGEDSIRLVYTNPELCFKRYIQGVKLTSSELYTLFNNLL